MSQRIWDRDAVVDLISRNDEALKRALVTLYNRQTPVEQEALQTTEHNGRGFNGRDAGFLSDIARKLPRYGNRMTARQTVAVRKALPKYWRQLLEEIESKGGLVDYGTRMAKEPQDQAGFAEIAKEQVAAGRMDARFGDFA